MKLKEKKKRGYSFSGNYLCSFLSGFCHLFRHLNQTLQLPMARDNISTHRTVSNNSSYPQSTRFLPLLPIKPATRFLPSSFTISSPTRHYMTSTIGDTRRRMLTLMIHPHLKASTFSQNFFFSSRPPISSLSWRKSGKELVQVCSLVFQLAVRDTRITWRRAGDLSSFPLIRLCIDRLIDRKCYWSSPLRFLY